MKLLKDPLLHFLLIGGALFALYAWSNRDAPAAADARRVVVTAGRIEQLARIFGKTWQRPPTPRELKGLIDDFVLEEVYYRKAKSMGLDQDDTMIRRRLRQKMEFLTEDAASLAEPSDDELAAYLAANRDKFRTDPAYTFRQTYFNPERHGDDPMAVARARADELRAGGEVEGDRSLLPGAFEDASRRVIDNTFGTGFAAKLDAVPEGEWSDPIRSGLGLHLVNVKSRTPARLPELGEVRNVVQREWANDRRIEVRRKFDAKLLEDFEVVIDWPEERKASGETAK